MQRPSELERRGIRLRKTFGANPSLRVYEYWARPVTSPALHRVGQVSCFGDRGCKALRSMREGPQLKDFRTLYDAENWIAGCDAWGELAKNSTNEASGAGT